MKPERRLCNSKKKRTNSTREEVCVMEMHRHVIWLIVAFYEPPICNHDDGMHVSFITVYHHHIFSHRLILYDNHNVKQHTFLHEFSSSTTPPHRHTPGGITTVYLLFSPSSHHHYILCAWCASRSYNSSWIFTFPSFCGIPAFILLKKSSKKDKKIITTTKKQPLNYLLGYTSAIIA